MYHAGAGARETRRAAGLLPGAFRTSLRWIAVLLIAASYGCSRVPDETSAETDYDSALEALRRGDLDDALQVVRRARAAERDDDPVTHARLLLLEAEIRLFRREPGEAASLLARPLPDTAAFAGLHARQAQLLGQREIIEGRLEAAVPRLAEAARIAGAAGAVDVEIEADILRGQALLRLGAYAEADPLLDTAASTAAARGDRYREAVALHNLGHGRLVRNRYDEALVFFERVLALPELEPYTVYGTTLTNAALCYTRLGDTARAIDALHRAIATHERRGSDIYLEQALGELGSTYVVVGDFDAAVAPLERAIQVAQRAGQTADAALWAANLASAYLERQDWDAAERWNAEAERLGVDARNAPYQRLFTGRILEGRGRTAEAAQAYADAAALAHDDPTVQWQAAGRLGWMAHGAGNSTAATRHFEQALAVVERTRADLPAARHRLYIQQRTSDLYYDYVRAVIEQGDAERALSIADSGRARVLAERQGAEAPARRPASAFREAARRTGAVLLYYWFGESRSYAWVVTAREIRLIPLPASGAEIAELVAAYHRLLVDTLADPLAASGSPGERLYTVLVAPLASAIPEGVRVIIVPDGALGLLNPETLIVPGPRPHYWIEQVEIAIAPSLDALLADAAPLPDGRRLLLIGDADAIDPAYPALQYASTEMDAVAGAFADSTVQYRGGHASPHAYRSAPLDTFGMVHFTAHAEPNAASPLDSAVILSDSGSEYKLYARDVVERPLSADLVTISACRSAIGRTYAGEGLVGFAWAFLRAGARRVIAGLWDVDDRSTAILMERLYTDLASGRTPSGSLRAAKLSMIREGGARAKPYYWAPFQVFVGAGVVP